MTDVAHLHPIEQNRHALGTELDRIADLLQRYLETGTTPAPAFAASARPPVALATLCDRFGLSGFERDLLLLCAGVELDPRFAPLCTQIGAETSAGCATVAVALGALSDPHWSALAPRAPLRHWALLEVDTNVPLIRARLRLDERILQFLLGIDDIDRRLAGLLHSPPTETVIPRSHRRHVEAVCAVWGEQSGAAPTVWLTGDDPSGARAVVARACTLLGWQPLVVRAADLPREPAERDRCARRLERECTLRPAALLLQPAHDAEIDFGVWLDTLDCPLALIGGRAQSGRPRVAIEVRKPLPVEQRAVWQDALGGHLPPSEIEPLAAHFHLGAAEIHATAAAIRSDNTDNESPAARAWRVCRETSRGGLQDLAQRIELRADWTDLVLPDATVALLGDLTRQLRHRTTVYERWGFAGRTSRGLGVSALFAGDSGTGKTLAAEVVAGELGLDLYRIDLSAVVSKYIGETEKNLQQVFTAAETSGAVLLFDEADALFGKRSEVRDSHDRYANVEVAYLLQRMESYRGLAILTTNLKSVVDPAFLRRIRFVVQFPFPDVRQRAEIWKRMFPAAFPGGDIQVDKLARLNVAGGNIRNIAVNAAFLAAEAATPMCMAHLAQAARMEYAKLEKALTETEIGGWL